MVIDDVDLNHSHTTKCFLWHKLPWLHVQHQRSILHKWTQLRESLEHTRKKAREKENKERDSDFKKEQFKIDIHTRFIFVKLHSNFMNIAWYLHKDYLRKQNEKRQTFLHILNNTERVECGVTSIRSVVWLCIIVFPLRELFFYSEIHKFWKRNRPQHTDFYEMIL